MIRELVVFRLVMWLLAWQQLVVAVLVIAVIASSFGVSLAAFQTREQYSVLQKLNEESDQLDSEYEKLLLEQSAWAGYARIDEVAREELGMQIPQGEQVVVVTP
ncbi:MAG: cell division protein FtsL [Pseudomonadales bacterium]